MRIEPDTVICKDYFLNLWSENDDILKNDIEFMYSVYNDLQNKLNINN